jgi:hypothetical protein
VEDVRRDEEDSSRLDPSVRNHEQYLSVRDQRVVACVQRKAYERFQRIRASVASDRKDWSLTDRASSSDEAAQQIVPTS